MKATFHSQASRRVVALWLAVAAAAFLYGCAAPVAPVGTPGGQMETPPVATSTAVAGAAGTPAGTAVATAMPAGVTPTPLSASGQELAGAVCVCHVQNEFGAPAVSALAQVAPATIRQTVRQGKGQMPAWSTQNLSEDWLTAIVDSVQPGGS